MKTKSKHILIHSSPDKVFAYMDNIGNTGMHMMKSSMPMMGSKLQLQQLSSNNVGPDVKFRWFGKMIGLTMDFTVIVTKWIQSQEKVWETVGDARMIILSWYRMHLLLIPIDESTKVELSIDYEKPKNLFFGFIAFFLAPLYANWCLGNMLHDSQMALQISPVLT